MWYWQLVSFGLHAEFLETDGYEDSMEACFKDIQENVWRLDSDRGAAYVYFNGDRTHPFKLDIVKRNS